MEKAKLQQLQNLLDELEKERLTVIAKDLGYKDVDELGENYSWQEIVEFDDGDNLLEGLDIVAGVVSDELKK